MDIVVFVGKDGLCISKDVLGMLLDVVGIIVMDVLSVCPLIY